MINKISKFALLLVLTLHVCSYSNAYALTPVPDELRERAEAGRAEGEARVELNNALDDIEGLTEGDHGWENSGETDVTEDSSAGESGLYQTGGADGAPSRVVAPRIPKPDTLPGPTINDAENVHERYFITNLIPSLVRVGINLLTVITVIALMFSGIQYLTAYGDDSRLENAKRNITYSIVGLLIAMFSYTIVAIISNTPLTNRDSQQQIESDTTNFNNQVTGETPPGNNTNPGN